METCWVYAILVFLAAVARFPRALSPLSLFAAYWVALIVGRTLPPHKQRWIILQLTAISIAVVTLLTIVRLETFDPYSGLFDSAWLPRYVRTLLLPTDGFASEHLASLGVLYVFVRGLGYGQRPLTLWFVGFQFRLGIVAFFLLLLVANFLRPFDASPWIFVYFFLSLLAVALARIDEMDGNVRLRSRWALILLAAIALVIFLGLGVAQVFTLDAADAVIQRLAPLSVLFGILLLGVLIPAGILLDWVMGLLQPLFRNYQQAFEALGNLVPSGADEFARNLQQTTALAFLAPLFRTLSALAIVLGVGYLLARALNRRMQQSEDAAYLRESIGAADDAPWRGGAARTRNKPRRRRGSVTAESIRRIYAALVARASDAGLPRRIAETPYEFLPRLQHTWPEEADRVRTITEAYVAVHYGEREFGAAEVNRLRGLWKRVEETIKRKA